MYRNTIPRLDPNSYEALVYLESNILFTFLTEADRQGLRVPPSLSQAQASLMPFIRVKNASTVDWPPSDLLELMALAQHYGVPTRLLDWTTDQYAACYFAAEGVMLGKSDDPDLTVWACGSTKWPPEKFPKTGLEIFKPPYYGNENLRSQSGLFMYLRGPSNVSPEVEAFPEFLDRRERELGIYRSVPLFTQMILPRSQASVLITLLQRIGVTATTLFPGYYGAARSAAAVRYNLKTAEEYDENAMAWNERHFSCKARLEGLIDSGRIEVLD